VPDVEGYTGPRPVWAEWYDKHVIPAARLAEQRENREALEPDPNYGGFSPIERFQVRAALGLTEPTEQ
jgi:hypothetical protein